jgi:hypothetical protein
MTSSLAHAEPGASAERPLSESLQGAARTAYASGNLLLNNGDSAGALSKFQQAYDLSKDPRLLFNMAICEKNVRAYAKMQGFLQRYEREGGRSLSAQDRATVDDALAAIKDLVGLVTITVSVPGAAVSADGETVGTSPLASPVVLDLGKHSIVVQKAGYDRVEQSVEVRGGQAMTLTVPLAAQSLVGHLVVSAERGSTIVIDGKPTGEDRFDGNLPAGPHQVRVSAEGKEPFRTDVEIREHETRTLQVSLANAQSGQAWPWVVGGAAVVVAAVVGGYFLFQTHDMVTAVPVGPNNIGQLQLSAWRGR